MEELLADNITGIKKGTTIIVFAFCLGICFFLQQWYSDTVKYERIGRSMIVSQRNRCDSIRSASSDTNAVQYTRNVNSFCDCIESNYVVSLFQDTVVVDSIGLIAIKDNGKLFKNNPDARKKIIPLIQKGNLEEVDIIVTELCRSEMKNRIDSFYNTGGFLSIEVADNTELKVPLLDVTVPKILFLLFLELVFIYDVVLIRVRNKTVDKLLPLLGEDKLKEAILKKCKVEYPTLSQLRKYIIVSMFLCLSAFAVFIIMYWHNESEFSTMVIQKEKLERMYSTILGIEVFLFFVSAYFVIKLFIDFYKKHGICSSIWSKH